MAAEALATERLLSLRRQIAALEGEQVARLDDQTGRRTAVMARPMSQDGTITAGVTTGDRTRAREPAPLCLSTGVPRLDQALGGGLPEAGSIELFASQMRDAGAATGLTLAFAALYARAAIARHEARPILWISDWHSASDAGLAYVQGLAGFGLPDLPDLPAGQRPGGRGTRGRGMRPLLARPRKLEDALWMAEAGLKARAFCAVILEISGNPVRFGLNESRRLGLKAKASGTPLLLLRQAGQGEAASIVARMAVTPAPARACRSMAETLKTGGMGYPAFHLVLEKSRLPAPDPLTVEWNPDECRLASLDPANPDQQPRTTHSGPALSAPDHRPDLPQALGTVLAFGRAS